MNFSRLARHNKGFTLIELLVVIAIIGVLSSVVLVSLDQARSRARDAQRLSDMRAIAQALELFHLDHGHYPGCNDEGVSAGGEYIGDNNGPIEAALEEYLGRIPRDPLHDTDNENTGYHYSYDPDHMVGPAGGPYYWGAVFGFNRAEGPCSECSKDTWLGNNKNLDGAVHNVSLGEGTACRDH